MRLSISNIAWDPSEDDAVAALLRRFGVNAIDVAPSKYFPEPDKVTDQQIARIRKKWADFEIIGMQSLLFGTQGLNLFGSWEVQKRMLEHLSQICRIGAGLGAKQLVFGSPKNRDRSELSDLEAAKIAKNFFWRLGGIAQTFGVNICLEPNPVCYGANFLTNSTEVGRMVEEMRHPNIRMQLDIGALTINEEDPMHIMMTYAPYIAHVHVSEPNLVPLGQGGTCHEKIEPLLRRYLPNAVACIEILATQNEPHLVAIERSLNKAVQYGTVNKADERCKGCMT